MRSEGDQLDGSPIAVSDQAAARMSVPISPPETMSADAKCALDG